MKTDTEDTRKEDIRRNLEDAGCDSETITRFCSCNHTAEQLEMLSRQRRRLLDRVHDDEQKISNLDYLVYQLEKEAKAQ